MSTTEENMKDLAALAVSTDEVVRARALAALLSRRFLAPTPMAEPHPLGCVLEAQRERDEALSALHAAQQEMESMRLTITYAEADVDRLRPENVRLQAEVKRLHSAHPLPLEVILTCLGGVLNDMTNGGERENHEAASFLQHATCRLKSLAMHTPKAEATR